MKFSFKGNKNELKQINKEKQEKEKESRGLQILQNIKQNERDKKNLVSYDNKRKCMNLAY